MPLAKLYGKRLNEFAKRFESDGLRFVGVNSNRQDSVAEVKRFADQTGVDFPIVKDLGNVIADRFDAKRTPEVIVVDQDLAIRYRGRIDDQYDPGVSRMQPERHYLRDAIESIVSGKDVASPVTDPVGCLIGRVKHPIGDSQITYCKQVARVLQRNCIECHRDGAIGPFSLTDYDEVIGWADMIVEVIEQRRMPPWHAESNHAPLSNERIMAEADKQVLREWVTAGTPYGDAGDLPKR